MKKKNILVFIVIIFCFTLLIGGCSSNDLEEETEEKNVIIDILGREVEISGETESFIAIGPGALRLCCYFKDTEMIVGVEQIDQDDTMGKPYVMANPIIAELPIIGQGGPNNSPDPERILAVNPDVIFTTYAADRATADNLQSKTAIPVVAISYGETSVFDPAVNNSLEIIGKVLGKNEKAEEIVKYIDDLKKDLHERTKDIPEDEKPSVYVGALNMKGIHGIESTQGNYSLFNAINAKNVVDDTGKTGTLMVDKEKIIEWDPDIIIIDSIGFEMFYQDYQKNRGYYETLSAIKNGEIYQQLPYNNYTTNIDTAIADAYYIGKVLYPEQFKDIEAEKQADEIYTKLIGKALYSELEKEYGGFKKVIL